MTAFFEQGILINYTPLGHAQVTISASAVGLPSIPNSKRVRRAAIRNSENMRWKDDGVDPTATEGFYALADEIMVIDGDLTAFKMIKASDAAGDPVVHVAYYGT